MSGHKRTLRMNAKLNRYDLRPWDVGKLPLYGSALTTVQAATLYCLYGFDFFGSNFKVQLPGQARGCSMRMAWITLPQPRRNKPWPSCPRRQVFLRLPHRRPRSSYIRGPYRLVCEWIMCVNRLCGAGTPACARGASREPFHPPIDRGRCLSSIRAVVLANGGDNLFHRPPDYTALFMRARADGLLSWQPMVPTGSGPDPEHIFFATMSRFDPEIRFR